MPVQYLPYIEHDGHKKEIDDPDYTEELIGMALIDVSVLFVRGTFLYLHDKCVLSGREGDKPLWPKKYDGLLLSLVDSFGANGRNISNISEALGYFLGIPATIIIGR